ncbi:MAG: carbohydrate ABC transporter permease [Anaerolineae bacterium]
MAIVTRQSSAQAIASAHARHRLIKALRHVLSHLILLCGSVFFVAPLLFMISTSLKASRQIALFPPVWIPDPIIWRNYKDVFLYAPMHQYFFNTLLITATWVFGASATSSLAAYAFARIRAPGRDLIFMILLSTLMLPGVVTLIPQYIIFARLDWVGTFLPLTVPALSGSAFYIFLMRQFFMTIPMDLEDAALIDGCGRFRTWSTIILPLAKPVLATAMVFAFMNGWNDYMGPLIYLNNKRHYTMSLGLQVFTREHSSEWGMLMAASTMMVTPIILLFFVAQKNFVQGITMTGLKG